MVDVPETSGGLVPPLLLLGGVLCLYTAIRGTTQNGKLVDTPVSVLKNILAGKAPLFNAQQITNDANNAYNGQDQQAHTPAQANTTAASPVDTATPAIRITT